MLGKISDWQDVAVDVRFPDSLTTAEVGRENVQNGFWKPWCGCDPDGHCIECVCDYEWACPAVTTRVADIIRNGQNFWNGQNCGTMDKIVERSF